MGNRPSQDSIILEHLKGNSVGITSIEAFSEYGITRLSAVIFRLRKAGHNIVAEDMSVVNRYGTTVHFSRYKLIEGGEA